MSAGEGPYTNTPWRDSLKEHPDWIYFSNAYSHQTHTEFLLSAALSEGRNLTGITFPQGQNIISLSRKVGIKTYWLSSQASLGPWDNMVSALAHSADNRQFTQKVYSHDLGKLGTDEALLPLLDNTLQQLDISQNNLLIIHLMGSHTPYQSRYPKNFPEININEVGWVGNLIAKKEKISIYQSYLTAIQHTDMVLEQLFSRISHYSKAPTFFLYFADHADDIFAKRSGHDWSVFTWSMARIPMFLWLSEGYRERYPHVHTNLEANSGRVFTNDLIFDLYLGLANINWEEKNDHYDISSPTYSLTLENAIITEGKKIRDDPLLIASRNMASLKDKLAIHRANTIFKARQGQKLGMNNLEVDLRIQNDASGQINLIVGHDSKSDTGMPFETWLTNLTMRPDFIWLDVKNLDASNAQQTLKFFEDLDKKYGLKKVSLFESSNADQLKSFSDAGWETSYYLPWAKLIEAEKNSDKKIFEGTANTVRANEICAVSYDLAADEVVHRQLFPLLPKNTSMYAWNTSYSFISPDLHEQVAHLGHLKKLLVSLPSPYNY